MAIVRKCRLRYSRNGCEECRRRKVKCDEAKPTCGRCAKRSCTCLYTAPKARKQRSDRGRPKVKRPEAVKNEDDNEPVIGTASSDSSMSGILTERAENVVRQFTDWDFATGFGDLQGLELPKLPVLDTEPMPLLNSPGFSIHSVHASDFGFQGDQSRYLEHFCDYSVKVLSPLTVSDEWILVRDILLTYARTSDCLMAAILCWGAFAASKDSTDPARDEAASSSYLVACTRSLLMMLSDPESIQENIESIILTVLLLSCYSAISSKQQWRPHLRAVKGLLAAYVISGNKSRRYSRNWHVIAFCWSWCTSIEVIAFMTAPTGGTVENEEEINSVMLKMRELQQYLQEERACRQDGFNYVYGYANELYETLQQLNKYLIRLKGNTSSVDVNVPVEGVEKLLEDLRRNANFQIIDRKGFISAAEFDPDNYENRCPEPLPPESLEKMTMLDGQEVWVSWCDLSHQVYVCAATQIVYTRVLGLPVSHFIVQKLVRRFLDLLVFLRTSSPPTKNYALYILHCPVYVAALNCITEPDRALILKFFHYLDALGPSTAETNAKKLRGIWDKYDSLSDKLEGRVFCAIDDWWTDTIAY